MSDKEMLRSELTEDVKWNLEDMYKNEKEWSSDYSLCKEKIKEMPKFKDLIANSANELYSCLKKRDEIQELMHKLYVYAHLKLHEDSNETLGQQLSGKGRSLEADVSTATSFIEPTILTISDDTLKSYLSSNEKLQEYKHFLNDLTREKAHILGAEQEELLAGASMLSNAPQEIYSMLSNADMTFGTIKDEDGKDVALTHGKYSVFLESSDIRVRKDGFEGIHNGYLKLKSTMASSLNANVLSNIYFSKARKYKDCLSMYLSSGNIPTTVYHNLINTVTEYLPYMHEYVEMRQKRLNLNEIHLYDLYAPIVDYKPDRIAYKDATEMVMKSTAVLGDDYVDVLKEAFSNRWVDVYENKGKRSGAFSWGEFGTHPYVLMNYTDTLSDMFTLSHEMGHALHSYYSWETQPYQYSNYTIFLAEIASTANESLLHHYLLENTNDEARKAYLYNNYLDKFRGTVFRQTMFAEFELKIHELAESGEVLTSACLSDLYRSLNQKYYGKNIIVDEFSDMEWARIPHFYTSFYVYQYATGFSAAASLTKKILEEGKPAVDRYRNFLRQGSADYSISIMKEAGVDMEKPDFIKDALEVFKDTLYDLKK